MESLILVLLVCLPYSFLSAIRECLTCEILIGYLPMVLLEQGQIWAPHNG